MSLAAFQPVRRSAFTLIEVLAVITIMALVAASLAVNLGGTTDQTRILQAVADLRDLDARGRMLARTSESAMTLTIDAEAHRLQLVNGSNEEVLAERNWPAPARGGITITLFTDRPLTSVVLDRAGRSVDYTARITGGSYRTTLRFCGLTGLVVRESAQ